MSKKLPLFVCLVFFLFQPRVTIAGTWQKCHKVFLLASLAINSIPQVNGHIGDICQPKPGVNYMSGSYQLEATIAEGENGEEHVENDYLYSDEDCLLPLNHALDFLNIYPGDKIIGLQVSQNQIVDSTTAIVLPLQLEENRGPDYWNRLAVIINSSMNPGTADRVMGRTSEYFDAISRGLLTMDHQVVSVEGTISCSLPENYRNFYNDAKNLGSNFDHFSKVTFIGNFPCNWGGVAFVGGRISAIQAYREESAVAVEIHESGHLNRGGHASTEEKEYGDHNDPLGSGYNHVRFNAPHLEQFGFLREQEIMTIDVDEYGEYELRNLDDYENNQDMLQVLRIRSRDGKDIFVSFRNKVSGNKYSQQLRNPFVVEIHTHGGRVGENTFLRARLTEGEVYCIKDTGSLINVTATSPNQATVAVEEYDIPSMAPSSSPQPTIRGSHAPSFAPTIDPDGCPRRPYSEEEKIDPVILYSAIGAAGVVVSVITLGICYRCSKKNKR